MGSIVKSKIIVVFVWLKWLFLKSYKICKNLQRPNICFFVCNSGYLKVVCVAEKGKFTYQLRCNQIFEEVTYRGSLFYSDTFVVLSSEKFLEKASPKERPTTRWKGPFQELLGPRMRPSLRDWLLDPFPTLKHLLHLNGPLTRTRSRWRLEADCFLPSLAQVCKYLKYWTLLRVILTLPIVLCVFLFEDTLFNTYCWFMNTEFMATSATMPKWANTPAFSLKHATT